MRLKKRVKLLGLQLCQGVGLIQLVRESAWRSRRLLILAYHGFSLVDEHLWNPELFLAASEFEARLASIRKGGYRVLPLAEALKRLYDDTLPEKSVVITIDDGNFDFHAKAFPLLKRYGYPATVYLTTFYCDYNHPLFNHICSYMLWKRRGSIVPTTGLQPCLGELDLRTPTSRSAALKVILGAAEEQYWSAEEKDRFAAKLADALSLDYEQYLRKRLLHRMNAAEVSEVAAAGIDVQLHTHRHRTPDDRELFLKEIDENRSRISNMTGRLAEHFCYPSGITKPQFLPWLTEMGVASATTCAPGYASQRSNPLLLPRVLDGSDVSRIEFEGWLSGLSSYIPHINRPIYVTQ